MTDTPKTFVARAWAIDDNRTFDHNQRLIANLALSLDEFIAERTGGNPDKLIEVLRELAMPRTVELLDKLHAPKG